MGLACTNAKKRDKKERQLKRVKKQKEIKAQRVKSPTITQATDVLIGDEEENRKQEKKETGSGPPKKENYIYIYIIAEKFTGKHIVCLLYGWNSYGTTSLGYLEWKGDKWNCKERGSSKYL